jgi:hypothetical protein
MADGCNLPFSLPSFPRDVSRFCEYFRSSECCRTFELIISLNDLSFSDRSGAVLIELLCACEVSARSGAICLSVGEGSRGLFSSRIDLVLDSRLNGFGLFFLMTFGFEDEGGESAVESKETSDFEGPATGFLVVDRSTLGSANMTVN